VRLRLRTGGVVGSYQAGQGANCSTFALLILVGLMGWENRSGRTYYYRKERKGGSVRSVYVSGIIAPLADLSVAQRRAEGAEVRALIRLDRAADARAVRACAALRLVVERWLTAAGYHTHKRQWRRRRMAKQLTTGAPNTREDVEHLELLTQAIMADDPSDAAKRLVTEWLAVPGAWREHGGDLMGSALRGAVQAAPASGYCDREALRRGVEEMRAELQFEQSTLPERLLIEQVLLCWVRLGVLEEAQTATMRGTHQFSYLNYLEMATTHAQRRYTNAIQSLARVRRLLAPRGARVLVNALVVSAQTGREAITVPAEDVRQLGVGR
jgi:hypothetical protein